MQWPETLHYSKLPGDAAPAGPRSKVEWQRSSCPDLQSMDWTTFTHSPHPPVVSSPVTITHLHTPSSPCVPCTHLAEAQSWLTVVGEETPHAVWSRFTLRLTLPVDQVPNPPCCSFFFLYINVSISFIYIWLRWVFVAARGLSLVAVSGGYSSLRCTGFSLRWLLLLQSTGSRRTGFSSCGTRAQ